jgi:hypothetical protein
LSPIKIKIIIGKGNKTKYLKGPATCNICPHQWRTQEFFSGGGSTNSVEDRGQRERGYGGGSPLVRGSGGNCNFVQEIPFHIINVS